MSDAAVNMPLSDSSAQNERTAKMVLYFGIFSIVMLFAGLLSAYIITSYSELWVNIVVPTGFYISTVVILLSSVTSVDNLSGTYGEDYTITYQGKELIYENDDFYFPNDELREKPLRNEIAIFGNSAGSYIYLLSFVHLIHVVGGILFFIVILLMRNFSVSKTFSPARLRLGAIYWNFVDGLWIFLFLFLLLFH